MQADQAEPAPPRPESEAQKALRPKPPEYKSTLLWNAGLQPAKPSNRLRHVRGKLRPFRGAAMESRAGGCASLRRSETRS